MIDVINLTKKFGDLLVLDDITTSIKEGERIVVIGPSGGGKSTFLRCLNCLEDPTAGKIFFDGVDLADLKVDINIERQKMGMVFQQFNLFPHMTVMQNLIEAPINVQKRDKAEVIKEAEILLAKVGLSDKANEYPRKLSGGQQQRLCIARTLAVEPEVILMDEPTSALDPISTMKIEDLALELKKDYTIVIVTHNMQQAARISDKTAFFLLGELIEFNNTKELFANPHNPKTEEYITGRFG